MDIKFYIQLLKDNKIDSEDNIQNKTKKKIFLFIVNNIDEYGYINSTESVYNELTKLIIFIANNYYLDICDYIKEIFNTHIFKSFKPNESILYNIFFEKLAIDTSALEISNIYYNIISKIIFEIYLIGTTLNDLNNYYKYNNKLIGINPQRIKVLNDIIQKYDYFQNKFSANSYKLLIQGHLMYNLDKYGNKIIIENLFTVFSRIVLEFVKNEISNEKMAEYFDDLWNCYYAPSTPMFYNALKSRYNMLTSCFIINVEDNIDSIGKFYKKIINILKFNSGIGVILSKIRAVDRPVMDYDTKSNGIFNYIDIITLFSEQFKNYYKKRNTSINITLSIDHPDILNFLNLKLNTHSKNGIPYNNIFQTVSIPDEFIYRYLNKKNWYLISPEQHINGVHLYDVYGEQYSELYNKMINSENIDKIEIDPSIIFNKITNIMIQTGGPFLFFKDVINETCNFKDIINGTNLCTEILIPSNDEETACCNIISLNLKEFVKNNTFNFNLLISKIHNIVEVLNIVIDNTFYSDPSCKTSNFKHRPIAIGIQGLANLLEILDIPYIQGKELYRKIIECMYFESLRKSNELAKLYPEKVVIKEYEYSYEKYFKYQQRKKNNLIKNGLGKLSHEINLDEYKPSYISESELIDLKKNINEFGLINSLFIGLMPTSLSSGIYNNSESFEPFQFNIYKKTYASYDILTYNEYLVKDLINLKYFNHLDVLSALQVVNGDINELNNIPQEIRKNLIKKHTTLNNIKTSDYINFHSYIDQFVDQGISFNLSINNNEHKIILKSLIDLWLNGKKTIYYYRTQLNIDPLVFNSNINTYINKKFSISCNSCQ